MGCELSEKEDWKGEKIKVVGDCYDAGLPKGRIDWKKNIETRQEVVEYLKQSERYWYSKQEDWFGSEKRKNPA